MSISEDANHTRTQVSSDARNRPVRTVIDLDHDGTFSTAVNGSDIVSTTDYNLVDKPIAVTDSRGNTTRHWCGRNP